MIDETWQCKRCHQHYSTASWNGVCYRCHVAAMPAPESGHDYIGIV